MSRRSQTGRRGRPLKAAVFGARGFLGSALCTELSERGWSVLRISGSVAREEVATRPDEIVWAGHTAALEEVLRKEKPDAILYLAARYLTDHTVEDLDGLLDSNVRRPLHMFEAARNAGITSIVTAGTYWEELSEEDRSPVNLYAATRCAARAILDFYADAYGWSAVHLRVSDLYGPDDPRARLFSLLRRAVASQSPLPMSGGEQLLDLVYVDDAARAFALAAEDCVESPSRGLREYGVSTGTPLSLRDVVSTYAGVVGRPVPVRFGERPYREREVMTPRFIETLPGWHATVSLQDGIRAMEAHPGGLLSG